MKVGLPGWVADDALWGFCDRCERWRCSSAWFSADAPDDRACPVCGEPPSLLEQMVDGRPMIALVLVLPPGADFPMEP